MLILIALIVVVAVVVGILVARKNPAVANKVDDTLNAAKSAAVTEAKKL